MCRDGHTAELRWLLRKYRTVRRWLIVASPSDDRPFVRIQHRDSKAEATHVLAAAASPPPKDAHECQNLLDVAASMALDGQLAFAALARSEDELTRLEEERADLTTKRRRHEYMGSMYARGSEKISQTVVKATAVKKSADENHGQGPPQATRVRARNNPKAPPDGERRTAGWEH